MKTYAVKVHTNVPAISVKMLVEAQDKEAAEEAARVQVLEDYPWVEIREVMVILNGGLVAE